MQALSIVYKYKSHIKLEEAPSSHARVQVLTLQAYGCFIIGPIPEMTTIVRVARGRL